MFLVSIVQSSDLYTSTCKLSELPPLKSQVFIIRTYDTGPMLFSSTLDDGSTSHQSHLFINKQTGQQYVQPVAPMTVIISPRTWLLGCFLCIKNCWLEPVPVQSEIIIKCLFVERIKHENCTRHLIGPSLSVHHYRRHLSRHNRASPDSPTTGVS